MMKRNEWAQLLIGATIFAVGCLTPGWEGWAIWAVGVSILLWSSARIGDAACSAANPENPRERCIRPPHEGPMHYDGVDYFETGLDKSGVEA